MHKHNHNFEGASRGDRRPDFENFDEASENFEDVEQVHFRGGMWGFGPFGRGRGYWGGFGPQQFGGHGYEDPRQSEGHGHGHGGPRGGWGGPGFRGFRGGFGPGFRGFGRGFGPGFGPGFRGEWGGRGPQRGWGGGPGFGFRGGWGGPGGHHHGHHGQRQGNLDMKIAWLEQAQARIEERLGWVKQRLEELKAERARSQESNPQASQPDQAPQQASFYADSTNTDITML